MRILVFFDLPTTNKARKKAYIEFRRFLLNDGYDMLQWSVYCRICRDQDGTEKHMARLQGNLPPEGHIRCMQVTEKQFASMKILVGKPTYQESMVRGQQVLLL
jgi:CRISPR-associated protein Cas2